MSDKVQRKVRVSTHQRVLDSEPMIDGLYPMREWRIDVHILGTDGTLHPASVFESVTYKLHETFENNVRVLTEPPFEVKERGWGEFEVKITFKIAHGGGDHTVNYELHFRTPESYQDIPIQFLKSNKAVMELLAASGPVDDAVGEKRAADPEATTSKAKKPKVQVKGSVDLEKLTHGLEQLGEQDVLSIVQMISDNKTPDIYVKNDVEAGEFHVDLFTVPNGLLKSMWDFVSKKVEM